MRQLGGAVGWVVTAWAVAASLFHLYTAGYGIFEPRIQRSFHLLLLVLLIFVFYPARRRSPQHRPSVWDCLFAATSLVASGYLIWDRDRINVRWEGASEVMGH